MNSQRIQHLREEFEYTQEFVAEYLEWVGQHMLIGKLEI